MNIIRKVFPRLRSYLGVLAYDLPCVVLPAMRSSVPKAGVYPWTRVRNRGEKLLHASHVKGVKCDWKNGSDLYVTKILPGCGRMIFQRALRDFPVRFAERPDCRGSDRPDVSFVIGHRGGERLAGLLAVVDSIAAQNGCGVECIVVEHDNHTRVRDSLPSWVDYIHVPIEGRRAFSKSKTFNVGAKAARSNLLILHDGDMLVPADYAREVLHCHNQGYEFVSLKRFIFYLSEASSRSVIERRSLDIVPDLEAISQNLPGGGSCAIARTAYFDIGGFDERFAGWGGEDVEFLDRARTLNMFNYEFLPMIHLWHKAQEGKWTAKAPGFATYRILASMPVEERIKDLRNRS